MNQFPVVRRCRGVVLVAAVVLLGTVAAVLAQAGEAFRGAVATAPSVRCVQLELYIQAEKEISEKVRVDIEAFVRGRKGVTLRVFDITNDAKRDERHTQICQHFQLQKQTPLVYGCGQAIVGLNEPTAARRELQQLLTLTAYVRSGCPRCAAAKAYLATLGTRFPGFQVHMRDIVLDSTANNELQQLVRKHRTSAASLPVIHVCNELTIGFNDAQSSGPRLDAILHRWTVECAAPRPAEAPDKGAPAKPTSYFRSASFSVGSVAGIASLPVISRLISSLSATCLATVEAQEEANPPELPLPDELPLPGDMPLPDEETASTSASATIDLPVLGEIRVEELGLPLFTFAVGLVDGFNPCAMWVLLFLLSVLVNLHNRWKIIAVAGTFVFISGAAYFAFMAAWLNVFLLVGLLRWVQATLAVLAIGVGIIHIKDFFAFKQGPTLSIPEAAKPGIYERVRRIVTAENVTGAIIGAIVLAVLVNIVELLCTAGLPALYTQILAAQQLEVWQNYAYLLLYNLAYMLDDALMVTVVVVTLERHKLQETHGRWLKLVSGAVILVLGLVMLIRPELLGMSD